MTQLTVRDFRSQMATSLDRVDAGEHVFIRRQNHLYAIVPVEDDDLTITPELAAKIEKARQEQLMDHPRTGIGHPEPMKGGMDITWSRHVSAHNRVIYDIYDEIITVLVVEVEGHNDDKQEPAKNR